MWTEVREEPQYQKVDGVHSAWQLTERAVWRRCGGAPINEVGNNRLATFAEL
jgi:hypothetical protein